MRRQRQSWDERRRERRERLGDRLPERPSHRGLTWTRVVGGLLMLGALLLALDKEYPMARDREIPSSSEAPRVVLLPRGEVPRGNVDTVEAFAWDWQGPEVAGWEVVLLDHEVLECARAEVPGTPWTPEGPVAAALERGGRFWWFVEGVLEGRHFRSVPVPFRVGESGPEAPLPSSPR